MADRFSELILCRSLTPIPAVPQWPAGFSSLLVRSTLDEGFAELNQFYECNQFPQGWAKQVLELGCSAVIVTQQDNARAASIGVAGGWATRRRFFIDELGRWIEPGVSGVYFFGDLVGEPWRGRGLQRQLIRARMHQALADGALAAYSVTHRSNLASLKSYDHESFHIALEIQAKLYRKIRLDKMIWDNKAFPGHQHAQLLSTVGYWLPLGYRLRRRGKF